MITKISSIEEDACNFMEGSSYMDPYSSIENLSVSLQSFEPLCVTNNDSSKSFAESDFLGNDVLVGSFDSLSIIESFGQRDNEGKGKVNLDGASESKCPDIICASPRKRSTRMSKSKQKAQIKKAAGKCRKAANKETLLDPTLLKVVRRRRSFLYKRARSSVWGLLGEISQVFEQNIGLDVSQTEDKKSRNVRNGRGRGKRNKKDSGGCLRRSKGKSCASSRGIRLKVKLGNEVNQSCVTNVIPIIDGGPKGYWGTSVEFPNLTNDVEVKSEQELLGISRLQCCNENPGKWIMSTNVSVHGINLADKDMESTVVNEKLAGKVADDHHAVSCQTEVDRLGVAVDNGYLDPGTSPDSEVINLVPDSQLSGKVQEDLHDLISSQNCVTARDVTSSNLQQMSSKKGKKKDILPQASSFSMEEGLPSPEIINKSRVLEKCGHREKGDDFCSSEASISATTGIASGNTSSSEGFSREPLPSSGVTDFGVSFETTKVESVAEIDLYSSPGVVLESPESRFSSKLFPSTKSKGQKLPKSSKARRVAKSKSEVPDSAKSKGENACRQKKSPAKSVNRSKIKTKGDFEQVQCKMEIHPDTDDLGKPETGSISTTEGIFNLDLTPSAVGDQCLPLRDAWVCCDDCCKWRRIPATLADSIDETSCKWICKDNMDKAFADCSIPQEKSNAEINAELEISDEEDACDARLNSKRFERKHSTVPQQSPWTLIKSNLFLHRSRKTQTIDEIMVCHCKQPPDGRMGCRGGCLNRMLNIECVKGTCPCGELCSNQQFQKRKYAKLRWYRCGKKGYGLQLLENISRGQFLIEYVGEVLDMHAYEARQREYAAKGHKHFYFMTLNGSEVIDACAKGNLGRFINHSCDPNCRTEKWMVNGEVCIGLFALRDIKKGEEVTFDYNYVRVFGAAAKKCVCGSSQCRGYIGGDPLNTEVIVQGDSDEEYPEPIMVNEDGEIDDTFDNLISASSSFDVADTRTAECELNNKDGMDKPAISLGHLEITTEIQTAEMLSKDKDKIHMPMTAAGHLDITTDHEHSVNKFISSASQLHLEKVESVGKLPSSVQPVEAFLQPDDLTSKTMSSVHQDLSVVNETMNESSLSVQRLETNSLITATSKLSSDMIDTKRKSKPNTVEDRRAISKSRPRVKSSHSSSSVKKGPSNNSSVNVSKPQMVTNKSHALPYKPRKLLEGSLGSHFEAVEETLNELLDAAGGISKRKDATKSYLKLLLLTATSGGSGSGEAIQSNRDLSMILDALLKTKSKTVLFDIISKNGLQMLHNIMKRYRRDFNKIPILRKLLRVLEHLECKEVLTLEHINGGPSRAGVESFRESILTLTEHDDKQVHQIARKFRDKWFPRPLKKISCMEMDDSGMEFHRGLNCNRFSGSHTHWRDQGVRPMEAVDCIKQSTVPTTPVNNDTPGGFSSSCSSGCATNGTKTRKRKSRWDQPAERNPLTSAEHKELKTQPTLFKSSYSSTQPEVGEVGLDLAEGRSKEGQSCPSHVQNFSRLLEAKMADERQQNIDEDVPPGFSPPLNRHLVSSNASSTGIDFRGDNARHAKCPIEVVMGDPQGRFISRTPVSYGIPLSVVQQFGTPCAETVEGWVIAPGMPFHPFPPLPPYPRNKREAPTCATDTMTVNKPAEKVEQESRGPATYPSDQGTPSTSGVSPPYMDIPGGNIPHNSQRARGSYNLGTRYFRQQKWNNSKLGPPWIRNRNGWGSMGNNSRSGMCSIGVESVGNEFKGPYSSSEYVGTGVESAYSSTFQRHPQHQN